MPDYTKLKYKFKNIGIPLLVLYSISIYLPMLFTNIISIVLVFWIIINYKEITIKELFKDKIIVCFIIFYFIAFSGLLNGASFHNLTVDLEKKLSFIILPIAIKMIKIGNKQLLNILSVFFYSAVLVITYALCSGLLSFIKNPDYSLITHHGLSMRVNLHATYLSTFILFALSYPFVYLKTITGSKEKNFVLALSIILIFSLVLLSTRIIWFVMLIIMLVIFIQKREKKYFFYLLIFFVLIIGLILAIKPIRQRALETINYNNEYSIDKHWGGTQIRYTIWNSCYELLKARPLLGYGSSTNVQENLDRHYKNNGIGPLLYMMERNKKFNPHNQYFEEFLKFGLILGFYLIILLLYFFMYFFRHDNLLGAYFVIIISFVSITETILELNKGIVFFAFFLPLIYYGSFKENKPLIKDHG